MKVMSVLFGRWKGAKITTEHSMHVLRAYRVSLTSLRPNQVSCLTSGNCFGMFFLYFQFTFKWINIFYWKSYMYCSHSLHIFPIILLIWLFASVGSLQIVWEPYRTTMKGCTSQFKTLFLLKSNYTWNYYERLGTGIQRW